MPAQPEYSIESARAQLLGDRLEQYQALLKVVDPRSRVVGLGDVKRDDATTNKDFIVINGNLEIRRDFALKVLGVFGFEWEILDTRDRWNADDRLLGVMVIGKVITPAGRSFSCTGGCQPGEDAPKRWASSRGDGGLHVCLTIAETRATKRGVEAAIGAPVLNMLLKEVFPDWDWEDGANRPAGIKNVTPGRNQAARGESAKPAGPLPPRVQLMRRKYAALVAAGVCSKEEATGKMNRVYLNTDKPDVLGRLEREIDGEFASRGLELPQ